MTEILQVDAFLEEHDAGLSAAEKDAAKGAQPLFTMPRLGLLTSFI
jgi:hypothetical protein